jgi:hypothetical protein
MPQGTARQHLAVYASARRKSEEVVMPPMMVGPTPAFEPAALAIDEPACILAALIDGLTSPEHYSLQVRNGELFIALARGQGAPKSAPGRHAATDRGGC